MLYLALVNSPSIVYCSNSLFINLEKTLMYTTISMRKETSKMLDELVEIRSKKNPFVSYSKINIVAELITREMQKAKKAD